MLLRCCGGFNGLVCSNIFQHFGRVKSLTSLLSWASLSTAILLQHQDPKWATEFRLLVIHLFAFEQICCWSFRPSVHQQQGWLVLCEAVNVFVYSRKEASPSLSSQTTSDGAIWQPFHQESSSHAACFIWEGVYTGDVAGRQPSVPFSSVVRVNTGVPWFIHLTFFFSVHPSLVQRRNVWPIYICSFVCASWQVNKRQEPSSPCRPSVCGSCDQNIQADVHDWIFYDCVNICWCWSVLDDELVFEWISDALITLMRLHSGHSFSHAWKYPSNNKVTACCLKFYLFTLGLLI